MADVTSAGRWLPIAGYEGFYEVSDRGQVRSLDRDVPHHSGGTKHIRGRVLALTAGPHGHLYVALWRDGSQEKRYVHRLVLEAFDRPCPPGLEALHGSAGPADNRWPEAIHWGTHVENAIDMHRDGTVTAKLTAEIVLACRARHARGETYAAIAADYPQVSKRAIEAAVTGQNWGHLS